MFFDRLAELWEAIQLHRSMKGLLLIKYEAFIHENRVLRWIWIAGIYGNIWTFVIEFWGIQRTESRGIVSFAVTKWCNYFICILEDLDFLVSYQMTLLKLLYLFSPLYRNDNQYIYTYSKFEYEWLSSGISLCGCCKFNRWWYQNNRKKCRCVIKCL